MSAARCYACGAPALFARDMRPGGPGIVDACERHAQKFVGGELVTRAYLEALEPMVAAAAEGDPGEQDEPPRRGMVLIVDDEAPIRRALARVLRGMGWRTELAADPAEAALHYWSADVVLSDWDMPNGGGARMLAESGAPVVIYTGNPDAPPAGARVLCKPSEAETIDAALRAAMKGGA